jgi:hypothetical protein
MGALSDERAGLSFVRVSSKSFVSIYIVFTNLNLSGLHFLSIYLIYLSMYACVYLPTYLHRAESLRHPYPLSSIVLYRNILGFHSDELIASYPTPEVERTLPCRLSAAAYWIYSHFASVSGIFSKNAKYPISLTETVSGTQIIYCESSQIYCCILSSELEKHCGRPSQ